MPGPRPDPDAATPPPTTRGGRAVGWLFRNRETGGLTIAQVPNLPLALFLGLAIVRRVVGADGGLGTFLALAAAAALTWWAVWEVTDGVNPWRRILGGAVLAVTLAGLAGRLLG